MKLSMARVSVSSCRPQTSSRMDLRETVRPLLRIRWRRSFASISVSWMTVSSTRNSSVPKSIVLPLNENTSASGAELAAEPGLLLASLSAPVAAQQALEPCEKYRQLERLRQVIVGARGKSFQHIFGAASRGENQNGNIILSFAQSAYYRETV